jgi:hypothetical protein
MPQLIRQIKRYNATHYDEILYTDFGKTSSGKNPHKAIKKYSSNYYQSASVKRAKNTVRDLVKSNTWEWWLTLTFDKSRIDSDNLKIVHNAWRTMRRSLKGAKYVAVLEKHKLGGYHLHLLLSQAPSLAFERAVKHDGSLVFHKGRQAVYWLKKWQDDYGYTKAIQVSPDSSSKIANYITKYITKDMDAVGISKKRYWASKNLDKPTIEFEVDDYHLPNNYDETKYDYLHIGVSGALMFARYTQYEGRTAPPKQHKKQDTRATITDELIQKLRPLNQTP